MDAAGADLLERIEAYYDAVPRTVCRAEDHGALTLFVQEKGGPPYYARPTPGYPGPVRVADVVAVRSRQRDLGVPESIEWVAEVTPGLRAAALGAGLAVHGHPLLVHDGTGTAAPVPVPDGVTVAVLGPDDPALAAALAVPEVGFAHPDHRIGGAGTADLDLAAGARVARRLAGQLRTGGIVLAAAVRDGTVLSSGRHQPVRGVSEIVGVATLPAARRQGLAAAVTAALVRQARGYGVEVLFLSAGDDDTARLYRRLGFRPLATAMIAEPAGTG